MVLDSILRPLKELDIDGAGIEMDCGDGYRRNCYPIMCSWLSDHEEHAKLHALANNWCPVCTIHWNLHQVSRTRRHLNAKLTR